MPVKWDDWIDIEIVKLFSKHASAATAAIVFFAIPSLVAALIHRDGWFSQSVAAVDAFLAVVVLLLLAVQLLGTLLAAAKGSLPASVKRGKVNESGPAESVVKQ